MNLQELVRPCMCMCVCVDVCGSSARTAVARGSISFSNRSRLQKQKQNKKKQKQKNKAKGRDTNSSADSLLFCFLLTPPACLHWRVLLAPPLTRMVAPIPSNSMYSSRACSFDNEHTHMHTPGGASPRVGVQPLHPPAWSHEGLQIRCLCERIRIATAVCRCVAISKGATCKVKKQLLSVHGGISSSLPPHSSTTCGAPPSPTSPTAHHPGVHAYGRTKSIGFGVHVWMSSCHRLLVA